jgi:hypothetical protein
MTLKTCKWCGDSFNPNSPRKVQIGGYINECPDCVEDNGGDISSPKYVGVAAGNGKMSDITILSFETEEAREAYTRAWRNNAGFNKGKSCQLGRHLTSMHGMAFNQVAENIANSNHKGKG